MIFLSELLRQSIYDSDNRRIGILRDVWVTLNETFPIVTALVIQHGLSAGTTNNTVIPWSQVQSIEEPKISLTIPQGQIAGYTPQADEILLKRDILDKQIVDTQGFRVVKVNDLKLAQIKHTARLVGVDIGMGGLFRRLGIETPVERLSRIMRIRIDERTITWNHVEPLQMIETTSGNTGKLTPVAAGATGATGTALVGTVPQVQLNVAHNKISDLRPADIADILEQLDVEDAGAMLERLDTETAADTLNEIEYPLQYELLSELDPERASDLLERLAPDDAADILSDIPQAEADRLLNLMPASDAQSIRDLLRYGGETAGGLMTTEVLALPQDATVEDALVYMRQHSEHLEMVYYLYIIDEEQHLMGVVSLRQLVISPPATRMRDLMNPDVIKVYTGTDQEEVAHSISKYDLLAVPVVDADNRLVGMVTVDDVIDVIHEEQAEDISEIAGADVEEPNEQEGFSWQTALNRFGWLGVNLIAGFVVALLLYRVFGTILAINASVASIIGTLPNVQPRIALGGILCLLPMLLFTCGSAGSQSLGIAGWQLRQTRGRDFIRSVAHELQLSTFGGIITSIIALAFSWVIFHSALLSIATGIGFAVTLLFASFCGLALPNLFYRLRLRGSFVSAPLIDPFIAVISIFIFTGIALLVINTVRV
jgi:Mg2+ transporter MgtE